MSMPVYPLSHRRALDYTGSMLNRMIPNESELTANVSIRPGKKYGFFTDTSLCIGCKACEVACKEWNVLPAEPLQLTGMSYDNSKALSATTWRHVKFIENLDNGQGDRPNLLRPFQSEWLMMSDVCKHCGKAGCLEACPTGALFRTEFGTVVVQQDICNGCAYCVPSCPFGVIEISVHDGKAHKCTLCYDRLKGGLEPACAKTCPTNSIQFGELEELQERARKRVETLHWMGVEEAYLYGAPEGWGATAGIEELRAFFLLLDRPETYNLPAAPVLPSTRMKASLKAGVTTLVGIAAAALIVLATKTSSPASRPPAQKASGLEREVGRRTGPQ